MPLVAGVDCSTQSTKVLVVDSDDGAVVAAGHAPHEVTGQGGARETHPHVWWSALGSALASTGRAADVSAISVAGQQHGLVVLDADGRPLRPAVLWNDIRSALDAARLVAAFGPAHWARRIGSVPVASLTVTSWVWLRRTEPATAAATRAIRLPHDHLTERLTGRGVTDRGDASGTGWWSVQDEEYADDVLALPEVAVDAAVLPEVLGPSDGAGQVTAAAASNLGLRPGIAVGAGTGDNMGAALGLGLEPGVPVVSLGTSGTAYAVSTQPAADPSGVVAGFADATGRYLPLACTLNATLAVDRMATLLGLDRERVARETGVVVLPYFDGERTPNLPDAAASITGLRHSTTAEEILLATYEGAVAGLLEALDRIAAHGSGLAPDAPVVLIGGGARGRAWQEAVRRLSGRSVQVPEADELVALGAAAQAAALVTGEHPSAVAARWGTRRGTVLDPLPRDDDAMARIARARERIYRTPSSNSSTS